MKRASRWGWPWAAILGDIVFVNLGYVAAFVVRFVGRPIPEANLQPYILLAPWITVASVLLLYGFGAYSQLRRTLGDLLRALVLAAVALNLLTVAASYFFVRTLTFPRSVLLLALVFHVVLLTGWRWLFWFLRERFVGAEQILIVGNRDGAPYLMEKFLRERSNAYQVVGFVSVPELLRLGRAIDDVDTLLVTPELSREEKIRVTSVAAERRVNIAIIPDLYDILLMGGTVGQIDDLAVLTLPWMGLTSAQRLGKRVFDVVVAGLLLVVSAPFAALIALAVKLSSPGPVIYSQERVGRRGHRFMLHKFRTMYEDAEQATGPVLATEDDPRVTRVGAYLRSLRLDELPQLWNVLRGEMSLVGPRPERPVFVDEFIEAIPDYRHRLLVQPGITGLAQIFARYNTTAEDKLKYDLYYIRNYSFWLDLRILLQTAVAVLSRESAQGVLDEQVAAGVDPDVMLEMLSRSWQARAGK